MYTRQTKRGDDNWGGGRGHRCGLVVSMMATVVVATCLFTIRSAGAEDPASQAESFIRHGLELREAGNDDAAAREFKKAYDLVRTPRAAAQVGLAEQALGRWEDAESHVSESLLATSDPWIAKHAATLRQALTNIKDHVGRVEVIAEPEGAEVFVNGRLVGKAPISDPVHVRAGDVQVELRAPGYVRASRSTTLRGGQYQSIVIRLDKNGATAAPAGTASAVSGAVGTTQKGDITGTETTPTDGTAVSGSPGGWTGQTGGDAGGRGARVHAIAKWTAVGLAVGALALGTTATFIRYNKTSAFDKKLPLCRDVNGRAVLASDPTMDAPYCQDLLDGYRSARTWQFVGFVGAGVFAVTGLILALTQPAEAPTVGQRDAQQATLSKRARLFDWACTTMGANPGLSCQARF